MNNYEEFIRADTFPDSEQMPASVSIDRGSSSEYGISLLYSKEEIRLRLITALVSKGDVNLLIKAEFAYICGDYVKADSILEEMGFSKGGCDHRLHRERGGVCQKCHQVFYRRSRPVVPAKVNWALGRIKG